MSVIVGKKLNDLVKSISDCPEENIEYSGVNVGIDKWSSSALTENGVPMWGTWDNHVVIYPHKFIRARLIETFKMPNDILGMFTLRSKYAQRGLEHSTSILLKPNWHGQLILELTNLTNTFPIELKYGELIGQITFFECHDY